MKFNIRFFAKRVHNRVNYYRFKALDKLFPGDISDHFDSSKYDLENFHAARKIVRVLSQLFITSANKARIIECLKARFPSSLPESKKEADAICNHNIKILGKDYSLGAKINWHKDYVSGFEWPLRFYRDIKVINLLDDSDIKFPWELSRFHHAVTLGKAYWHTGDEKYANAFIEQIHSWIAQNPPNKGVNWCCAMEAAIRAINLIWGYFFFIDCEKLSDAFHVQFYNLISMHGKHIHRNLENKSMINGNHYIANLLGLLYISSVFPILRYSQKWKLFSIKELIKEMACQVYPDGTNFEASISYHGLVTEMFFHAAYVLTTIHSFCNLDKGNLSNRDISNKIFGKNYTNKLEKMFEFILYYTKPDGSAPQIGDNDSGRIVYFGRSSNYINDHRHLLAVAGEFFDRYDFRFAGRDCCEDAIWLFKELVILEGKDKPKVPSKAFDDSGIYVLREEQDYMILRCGQLGSIGNGTHTHNDNLSFELCAHGTTYIIDPGTYAYSADPTLRNLLRSTKYHNTLLINGKEQNDISKLDLFLLHKKSEPKVLVWETGRYEDVFAGEIAFFLNNSPFRHVREIIFNKRRHHWKIRDSVHGNGPNALTWNFHLNVGINVYKEVNKIILEKNHKRALIMEISEMDQFDLKISKAWYSPSYRAKKEATVLTLSLNADLPGEYTFSFYKK